MASDRPLHEVVAESGVHRIVDGWTVPITPQLAVVLKAADAYRHANFYDYDEERVADVPALDAAYDAAVADLRRVLEGK